jgi:hypothetical protein
MATLREVWAAYERARGRWSGCDWPTHYGSLRLDLKGVSARQAGAAARRWRAVAAGGAACEGTTPQEDDALAAMGLCLRLRIRTTGDGQTPPRPAPRPARSRCAEAIAEEWELAACVLEMIEADASLAESEAWAAVRAAVEGDWGRALRHARRASALESGYQAPRAWGGLQRAIEAAARTPAPAADGRGSLREPNGGASLTMQQKERGADPQARARASARLAEAVLRALGRPGSLREVQVRWLWADNYRVNVLTGEPGALAVIAHSYFLTADGAGELLEACPAIERRY